MEIWIGLAMFAGLIALLAVGVPVAFGLFGIGIAALFMVGGGVDALGLVAPTRWGSVTSCTPSRPRCRLSGLMSRCTMPRRCSTPTRRSMRAPSSATSCARRRSPRASKAFRLSPSCQLIR